MASIRFTFLLGLLLGVTSTVYTRPNDEGFSQDYRFAKKYLRQFHYLSPLKSGNHDLPTAVELFQRYMHIPVTGKLDKDTIKTMHKKRCGFPDIEENVDTKSPSGTSKRFAVAPIYWNKTALTYGFTNYSGDLTSAKQQSILAKAFKMWSDKSPLTFTFQSSASTADIKITFGTKKHGNCIYPFDGPGYVLGHAFYPSDGSLHFDDDENFTDGVPIGTNLLSVAVHEIGHVLGIAHSSETNAVMFSLLSGYNPKLALHADDINAIAYRYGGGTVMPENTPAPCLDLFTQCASFTSWCSTSATTRNLCQNTCNLCQQGGHPIVCTDNLDAIHCEGFRLNNRCSHEMIKEKCRKTCGVCH